jgi:putative alpha-1,2-mannosidase
LVAFVLWHASLCSNITGAPFTVYFYGEFSEKPQSATTFTGRNTDPIRQYQTLSNGGLSYPIYGNTSDKACSGPMNDRLGVLFSWDRGPESQIRSRVGISFVSIEKARTYVRSEIPSWDLDDTVKLAVEEWNQDVFRKIQVTLDSTMNETNVRLLYSSLYFMHLMPSDRTGENPLWHSEEPFWDDFYTLCEYIPVLRPLPTLIHNQGTSFGALLASTIYFNLPTTSP